jgi:type I restriction enzyme M protein
LFAFHDKLHKNAKDEFLPHIIDYATGSGHFITESMRILQQLLDNFDSSKLFGDAKKLAAKAKDYPYDWAIDYVYGIEKDYRLIKVGKVGCYLHGDGLARVIHSDGLGNFINTKEYKGLLIKTDKNFPQENKQFDILVSNPPYSVSAFKNNASRFYGKDDFELYNNLTDNSSEIECLFVERAKQLLKDGGVAGVILPSSILSNEGIYTKCREIILQYFDIVAIAELGSNTFMATGTNTVVLFLRRRNNYDCINLRKSAERFFVDFQDVTHNGIETPVAKYVNHVWGSINVDDYITLLKNEPNNTVAGHEIYQEYRKKINVKNEKDFRHTLIETETEKLYYFMLAYPQKVVLIKTGAKDAEKRFLGYEFSNRRGSEGIHPIQRGKTIDECTKLFDNDRFDNEEKASAYVYRAFAGDYDSPIHESLKNNILRIRLVDMLTFDRDGFAKNISTEVKKKVRYEEIWKTNKLVPLRNISEIKKGTSITKENTKEGNIPIVAGGKEPAYFHNKSNRDGAVITISASGAYSGFVNYFEIPIFASDCNTIQSKDEENISTKLIYLFLKSIQKEIYGLQRGQAQPHVYADDVEKIKIPLPPKEIQEKIVSEIEVLEKQEAEAKEKTKKLSKNIDDILSTIHFDTVELGSISSFKNGLNYNRSSLGDIVSIIGVGDFQNRIVPDLEKIEQIQIDGSLSDDYVLEPNDLLVVRSNGSANLVGRFLMIDKVVPSMSFSGFTIRVRPHSEKAISKYLCYYLRTEKIREKLTKNSGGSNIKSLNQTLLSSLSIPLPSLSEQQKIVAEIEKIEVRIAEVQKIIDDASTRKNEILKKYL